LHHRGKINEYEVIGLCVLYGGGESLKESDLLENLDVDRRIILSWILKK
jgi:hypothetical protein